MGSGRTHPQAVVEEAIESAGVGAGRRSGTASGGLAGFTGCSEHEVNGGFRYPGIRVGIAVKGLGSSSNRASFFCDEFLDCLDEVG